MNKNFFRFILTSFAFSVCVLFLAMSFFSCMSATTVSHGLENVAYLEIMGDTNKYQTISSTKSGATEFLHRVQVVIDGAEPFDADVNSIKNRAVENKYTYKIATGAHDVEISFEGNVVARTKVFVSANQTKIISLP